jgi:ankyrin repeat protein
MEPDIRARDDLALRLASLNGYLEVVELLLKKGSDLHAGNDRSLRVAS